MLLIDDGHGCVVAVRVRPWHRLTAHLHADRLNAALARGAAPDSSVHLALRARSLTGMFTRRGLAYGLQRTMSQAASGAALAGNRAGVLQATDQLEQLRRRLLDGALISPRGAAQIEQLLTDGSGPLYRRGHAEAFSLIVTRALQALEIADHSTLA